MEKTKDCVLVLTHSLGGKVKLKTLKSDLEELKRKSNYLFDERDVIKKEMIKEVRQGNKPSRKWQYWLKKVESFEPQVNKILENEKEIPKDMDIDNRVKVMIAEIVKLLEKAPFNCGLYRPMLDVSYGISNRMSFLMTEGEAHRTSKNSKLSQLDRKAERKSMKTVEIVKSPALERVMVLGKNVEQSEDIESLPEPSLDTSPQEVDHPRQYEYLPDQIKISIEKGARAVLDDDLVDEKGPALALTSEFEVSSSSLTKSLSIPDSAHSSGIKDFGKHASIHLPVTQFSATHGHEIELIPSETKEAPSLKEMENLETAYERNESNSSITKTESTILKPSSDFMPSGTKGKDQVKPKQKINFKKLFVLTKPAAVNRTGPNNMVMEKPQRVTDVELPIDDKRSINCVVQKILGCMNDSRTRRIGIYGIDGIGKTTILKELVNYLGKINKFDQIIWVSLTKSWSIRNVQYEVATHLGLSEADSESGLEVTEKLLHAFQSRRLLLLLDNVWDIIDLNAIGIPVSSLKNGCMIIISTRSEHVCKVMAPDEQIKVQGLSWEEAWHLFREQVGNIIESPDIKPFAQAIVACCGALPLTVIVIGRALMGVSDQLGWMIAARDFLSASLKKLHDNEDVLRQLKFSFDRLQSHELKSCFLYCALYPEGHKFEVTKLVDYGIQDGSIAGQAADARNKGFAVVKYLIDASLLESVDGGLSVKMHDVIRDLALWIISSEDSRQFFAGPGIELPLPTKEEIDQGQRHGSISKTLEGQEETSFSYMDCILLSGPRAGLTELPPEEEWEKTKMIVLMDGEFSRLPDMPKCPKLLILFLQRNTRLRTIPPSFFEYMPSLQVLNLSKTKIRSLPHSLFRLSRLEVLLLCDCECLSELPPDIENLERIEVLDLWGTEIYNLPIEIGKLSSLKHLRVSFYGSMDRSEYGRLPEELISRSVLSKLPLRELSVAVHPGDPRWDMSTEYIAKELSTLNELISLNFCFPEVKFLELFIQESSSWKTGVLRKFKFVVGQNIKRIVSRVPKSVEFDYDQEEQCLRYVNGDTISEVIGVLVRATAFYLDHHCGIGSVAEFGITNIKQLKFCILRECPNISTIIDGSLCSSGGTEVALPNLERLSIHYLQNLRSIWKGPLPVESFAKLKTLSVHNCPELEVILTRSMLQLVSNLEELTVEDCASVKAIVKVDVIVNNNNVVGPPKLRRLTLNYLPQLVCLWNGPWPKLEQERIFNCPMLKKMPDSQSSDVANRDQINGEVLCNNGSIEHLYERLEMGASTAVRFPSNFNF